MSPRKRTDLAPIKYETESLSYETVRQGVILKRDELLSQGYSCGWSDDLDLAHMPGEDEVTRRGYLSKGDTYLTSLNKGSVLLRIDIRPATQTARMYGNDIIPESGIRGVKKILREVNDITGIEVKFERTDKPPRRQ